MRVSARGIAGGLMATIVVSGSGKNVGKTSLICGLLRALPEFGWVAVKVTSHDHGMAEALFEETSASVASDTARFLAAGARRVFLITAEGAELGEALKTLHESVGPANLIFESNRMFAEFEPNVRLAIVGAATEVKASFGPALEQADAIVAAADGESAFPVLTGAQQVFRLSDFACIPSEMEEWLRAKLGRPNGN
jgi:hypothetical protein